jgi:hypothetical protein
MLQVLKFAPAAEVQRPGAGLGPPRRMLRAALLRAAEPAAQLAARLEAAEAAARERPVGIGAVRPYAPVGAVGVRLAEAVVYLAVAAYFVAGLIGVFVV